MSDIKKYIEIRGLSRRVLKKCDCCNKVQDVAYRCDIHSYDKPDLLEGDLYLCQRCGDNLNKIINGGDGLKLGEKVTKAFNF